MVHNYDLIPGLPNDLVQLHIVLKVMEPIMAIKQQGPDEQAMSMVNNYSTLLQMYRYLGVSRAWRRLILTRAKYNAFRLALWDKDEDVAYAYRGDMLRGFFDAMLRTYHENLVVFSTTQRISIPIAWDT